MDFYNVIGIVNLLRKDGKLLCVVETLCTLCIVVKRMLVKKNICTCSRQWWMPDTGGANIPALNELLAPLGMAFR